MFPKHRGEIIDLQKLTCWVLISWSASDEWGVAPAPTNNTGTQDKSQLNSAKFGIYFKQWSEWVRDYWNIYYKYKNELQH